MGNAGNVILFVFAVMAVIVVGLYVFAYASRCFITVSHSTASGNKAVVWGDEPFFDWMFQGVHVLWLLVVWLIPTTMILRVINREIYAEAPALVMLVYGIVIWILFPLGALSSMSGASPWTVFRPQVLSLLGRAVSAVGLFYLIALVIVALGLGTWTLALAFNSLLLIPVAGALTTLCLLLYARLLGRLAWRITPVRRRRKRRRDKPEDPKVPQPPADEEVHLKGEGLLEPVPDPYAMGEERAPNPPVEMEPEPEEENPEEMDPRRPVPKRERKLLQGWLSFFGDEGTLERAMILALGMTLFGFLFRFMLAMKP